MQCSVTYICSKQSSKILIEGCVFDNLSNTKVPGVVIQNCESVLSRVCAINCTSSLEQHFGNIYSLFGNYKSYLFESSLCCCGNAEVVEPTFIYHYGIIMLKSVNISYTTGKNYSACQFFNSTETATNLQYSSFANNSADVYMNGVYTGKFSVFRCNYQNNEIYSLFRTNPGILLVSECFIYNNKAKYYAEAKNGEITITKSRFIDNSIPNIGIGTITDENLNLSEFVLFHLNTFNCNAKDPFLHPVHKPYLSVHSCSCYSKSLQSYIWTIIIMTE